MEGQLAAMPDNDARDVKLAVDYLHTNGFEDIFLVGEEVGAWSVLDYAARIRDRRIAGVALLDPVADLADWLRDGLGAASYGDAIAEAGIAARQGAGMDYRIDVFPEAGPIVTQQAAADRVAEMSSELKPTANLRRDLTRFGDAILATVLSDESRAWHRFAGAEALEHPEVGQAFYAAGPARVIELLTEYRANPQVVRDRLRNEYLGRALSQVGNRYVVPGPPVTGRLLIPPEYGP